MPSTGGLRSWWPLALIALAALLAFGALAYIRGERSDLLRRTAERDSLLIALERAERKTARIDTIFRARVDTIERLIAARPRLVRDLDTVVVYRPAPGAAGASGRVDTLRVSALPEVQRLSAAYDSLGRSCSALVQTCEQRVLATREEGAARLALARREMADAAGARAQRAWKRGLAVGAAAVVLGAIGLRQLTP